MYLVLVLGLLSLERGSFLRRLRTKYKEPRTFFYRFSGDFVGRVTPVPIPNTEVKPAGADGTARVTAWESRKSPGLFEEARESIKPLAGFLLFTVHGQSLVIMSKREA